MPLTNSDFSTPYPTHRSLRHFSRSAPSHGLAHSTLIIIVASASVVGLLLTVIIWRFLSRLFRSKSAPLPPRQSLVHQRELQLAAFSEYKDAIVPQIHESDQATLDSSYDVQLHPPSLQIFPSSYPPSGSYSSLPSSTDDLPSSSGIITPPTRLSTSTSPSQSGKRGINRSGPPPRPMSTFSISSRQSTRGAPHAPHSNVQIVLPAPLAPNLYGETASDGSLFPRALTRDGTFSVRDSWRRSLADSWIVVGQDSLPDSEPMERQYGHDSMKRPTRLIRSMFVAFSMIFLKLNALFSKEDPPRDHFLREVDPTQHRPLAFVRLRALISSRGIHTPQCRAYLLNWGDFLETALSLPHRKEDH
jgi:hypothetical protein